MRRVLVGLAFVAWPGVLESQVARAAPDSLTAALVPLGAAMDSSALRAWSLDHGAPLIIIEGLPYVPQCYCDAGWCRRVRGGQVERRADGGEGDARRMGGEASARQVGGQVDARSVAGQADSRRVGGETGARRVGGEEEARRIAGQQDGRRVGGEASGRRVGGEASGRRVGGEGSDRSVGGQADARRVGGDAGVRVAGGQDERRVTAGAVTAFTCTVHRDDPSRLVLNGVRPQLQVEVFDGARLRRVESRVVEF